MDNIWNFIYDFGLALDFILRSLKLEYIHKCRLLIEVNYNYTKLFNYFYIWNFM